MRPAEGAALPILQLHRSLLLMVTFVLSMGCRGAAAFDSAAVQIAPDAPPSIPDSAGIPRGEKLLVHSPGDTSVLIAREYVMLSFKPATGGSSIRAFLTREHGTIVGGIPSMRVYIVRFPDPGPSWESVSALSMRLGSNSVVQVAMPYVLRGLPARSAIELKSW